MDEIEEPRKSGNLDLAASVILIFIGFCFGYIYSNYKNESCIEQPFFYGIEKLNEMNNANFTCSCNSLSSNIKPFSFNEQGLVKNDLFIINP